MWTMRSSSTASIWTRYLPTPLQITASLPYKSLLRHGGCTGHRLLQRPWGRAEGACGERTVTVPRKPLPPVHIFHCHSSRPQGEEYELEVIKCVLRNRYCPTDASPEKVCEITATLANHWLFRTSRCHPLIQITAPFPYRSLGRSTTETARSLFARRSAVLPCSVAF